jgi:hypothetical protein
MNGLSRAGLGVALLTTPAACGVHIVDVSGAGATAGATAGDTAGDTADVPAGSTALVAVVNPVVNSRHSTGVPGEQGDARDGVEVDPEPGGARATVDGLAVVGLPVASIDLRIGPAALGLDVDAAGDVLDAPIAFDGERAAYFANTPIRYPIGATGGAIFFDPEIEPADISATLAEDGAVVVLRPGVYVGDLVIKGHDVVLFGEGWADFAVVIDGDVSAEGHGARVRGVTITGELASRGNDFGVGFSRVLGPTSISGDAGVLLRNTFCGATVVLSTTATLLDNHGVAPLATPPPGACNL